MAVIKEDKIKFTLEQEISEQEISDLLACAFEGAINYWCKEVLIKELPRVEKRYEYACDMLYPGGSLWIVEEGTNSKHTLDLKKFIRGLKKAMKHFDMNTVSEVMDGHDAEVADWIIQFAIFNEIRYS